MRSNRRIRAGAAVAFATALMVVPTPALGDSHGFVLRRDGSKAVQVVTVPVPTASTSQFDWGDAGIGAGAGMAALALAAVGGGAVRSRHAHGRSVA